MAASCQLKHGLWSHYLLGSTGITPTSNWVMEHVPYVSVQQGSCKGSSMTILPTVFFSGIYLHLHKMRICLPPIGDTYINDTAHDRE